MPGSLVYTHTHHTLTMKEARHAARMALSARERPFPNVGPISLFHKVSTLGTAGPAEAVLSPWSVAGCCRNRSFDPGVCPRDKGLRHRKNSPRFASRKAPPQTDWPIKAKTQSNFPMLGGDHFADVQWRSTHAMDGQPTTHLLLPHPIWSSSILQKRQRTNVSHAFARLWGDPCPAVRSKNHIVGPAEWLCELKSGELCHDRLLLAVREISA